MSSQYAKVANDRQEDSDTMGLMSGLAFSATLDHAEEIANIKK